MSITENELFDLIEQQLDSLTFDGTRREELKAFFRGELAYRQLSFSVKEQFADYPHAEFVYTFMPQNKYGNKIIFPYDWTLVHRINQFLIEGDFKYINSIYFRSLLEHRLPAEYSKFYDMLCGIMARPVVLSFVVEQMLYLLTFGTEYRNSTFYTTSDDWLTHQAVTDGPSLVAELKDMSPKGRAFMLEKLAAHDIDHYLPILLEHMGDGSKTVRNTVISVLSAKPALLSFMDECLRSKKKAIRETAIRIIGSWKTVAAQAALEAAYGSETNASLKSLLAEFLPAEQTAAYSDYDSYVNIAELELERVNHSPINWIPWEQMSKVRPARSEAVVPLAVLQYWTLGYAHLSKMTVFHEGRLAAGFLNETDLTAFSMQLLKVWLDQGADAKQKWVLGLAAAHGGEAVVHLLKKQVTEWPSAGRGAIACEAIRALSVSGRDSALVLVDSIARNFKYRQVKEAAASAFDLAAQELGVDREALADRVVPTFGFGANGERRIDFGSQTFLIKLSQKLEIDICDAYGKKLKSLPKPGAQDDKAMAEAATDELKQLRKSLKSASRAQSERLEEALATGRQWRSDIWLPLFTGNPLLQHYATGLIWGIYHGGKLETSFRYMGDGTMATIDDQVFELKEKADIGLVHPLELTSDEIERWGQQLSDYEITQPFAQLRRAVYIMTDAERQKPIITRFKGKVLHPLSLKGRMSKHTWSRGDVGDGGMYHSFYKEDPRSGIGVQLQFSGTFVGTEGEYDEEVEIEEAFFFRCGSSARGSDTVQERDAGLARGNEIPPRLFSETMVELERITVSHKITAEEYAN